jgi:hypothetical protein
MVGSLSLAGAQARKSQYAPGPRSPNEFHAARVLRLTVTASRLSPHPFLRRLFVVFSKFHLSKNTLALQTFFENAGGLVDVVAAYLNLQEASQL